VRGKTLTLDEIVLLITGVRGNFVRAKVPSISGGSGVIVQVLGSRTGCSTVRGWASTEPLRKTILSLSLLFGAALTVSPQTTQKQHSIAVQFLYDFRAHQSCPAQSPCVKQFNVYNVTDHGQRTLLFTIHAPPGARAKAVHISGQSMPRPFASGQHMIAVTAQWDTGAESALLASTTIVDIKD
jgi:hypothetical protein